MSDVEHLRRLFAETGTVPAANQVEVHPRFPQIELRAVHAEDGIATEAWSPLAQGGELLSDAIITRIADQHGVTPAQVVLRGHIQIRNIAIPKSVHPLRNLHQPCEGAFSRLRGAMCISFTPLSPLNATFGAAFRAGQS